MISAEPSSHIYFRFDDTEKRFTKLVLNRCRPDFTEELGEYMFELTGLVWERRASMN